MLYWLLLCLTIAWLYWPALAGEVPAFRDAFHFYYPLEYWLATCADAGQYLPHFNPNDGTGSNLVGETSTGLCYPGRLLWWMPGLEVAQRFGVVLAVHTLIAAIGAAYAAGRMHLSSTAGCLAATAYALGGAVLFQHVNPVYLIGAAWTPWIVAECWALVHQGGARLDGDRAGAVPSPATDLKPRMGVWVGAAALMLLGGDPQATANAGIVTLLAILTRLAIVRSWHVFGRQLVWLGCAVMLVVGLTAMQWMPARHWLRHSQRSAAEQCISGADAVPIAEVPRLLRPVAEALQHDASSPASSPRRAGGMYAYSIAPWHLLTLLWGTAGGHYLPEHTRWLQALKGEPRMWTASLSIGLLPALWVIASWSQLSLRRAQRFLIVVLIVSGTAMLGNYAPVWALRNACQAVGADHWSGLLPGDEVGGMYWCLTKIVPGYSAFRYPAKWSVWFACALALCAAHAFDRDQERSRARSRLCTLIAALSVAVILAIAWLQWMPGGKQAYIRLTDWLTAANPDPWLGRLDATSVMPLWLQAAVIAAVVSTLCAVAMRVNIGGAPRLRALVLLLTLGELAWAGNTWLVTVDMSGSDNSRVATAAEIDDAEGATPDRLLVRVWASVGHADLQAWPVALADPEGAHRERVARVCAYQMVFRLGKLHLLFPKQANLSAIMSLTPRALSVVRYQIAQADDLRAHNPELDEALAWLGVSHRLVAAERLTWQAVPNTSPLVEIAADATGAEPSGQTNSCVVEHFSNDQLRINVSSEQPSRLIVRLMQDGGWSASLTPLAGPAGQPATLHRVPASTHLGLFQSLSVPAGNWSIRLSYRAPGWRLGLGITLTTLAFLMTLGLVRHFRSVSLADRRL